MITLNLSTRFQGLQDLIHIKRFILVIEVSRHLDFFVELILRGLYFIKFIARFGEPDLVYRLCQYYYQKPRH